MTWFGWLTKTRYEMTMLDDLTFVGEVVFVGAVIFALALIAQSFMLWNRQRKRG